MSSSEVEASADMESNSGDSDEEDFRVDFKRRPRAITAEFTLSCSIPGICENQMFEAESGPRNGNGMFKAIRDDYVQRATIGFVRNQLVEDLHYASLQTKLQFLNEHLLRDEAWADESGGGLFDETADSADFDSERFDRLWARYNREMLGKAPPGEAEILHMCSRYRLSVFIWEITSGPDQSGPLLRGVARPVKAIIGSPENPYSNIHMLRVDGNDFVRTNIPRLWQPVIPDAAADVAAAPAASADNMAQVSDGQHAAGDADAAPADGDVAAPLSNSVPASGSAERRRPSDGEGDGGAAPETITDSTQPQPLRATAATGSRLAELQHRRGSSDTTIATQLVFECLDEELQITAEDCTVNTIPYGRLSGTIHIEWRAATASMILRDEVRAARAEGSCYLLCLIDLARDAERSISFSARRKAHPELQGIFKERWELLLGMAADREASGLRQAICIHLLSKIEQFRKEFPVPPPITEQQWLNLCAVGEALGIHVTQDDPVQQWAATFLCPSTHADEGFMRVLLDWLDNKVAVLNLLQITREDGELQFLHSSAVDHITDEAVLLLKVLNIEKHGQARAALNHFNRVSGEKSVEFLQDLLPVRTPSDPLIDEQQIRAGAAQRGDTMVGLDASCDTQAETNTWYTDTASGGGAAKRRRPSDGEGADGGAAPASASYSARAGRAAAGDEAGAGSGVDGVGVARADASRPPLKSILKPVSTRRRRSNQVPSLNSGEGLGGRTVSFRTPLVETRVFTRADEA